MKYQALFLKNKKYIINLSSVESIRLINKQANSIGNLCPPPYFYLSC